MIDELKKVMVLVDQSELEKLNERLSNLEKLLVAVTKKKVEDEFQWIESTKVPALLGVSRKTWQTYRDKRIIPYSQFGSKIHVRLSDLNDFMERNKIPSI
jgi:hypothetical protein